MIYFDQLLHKFYHCLDTGMQNCDDASPATIPAGRAHAVSANAHYS